MGFKKSAVDGMREPDEDGAFAGGLMKSAVVGIDGATPNDATEPMANWGAAGGTASPDFTAMGGPVGAHGATGGAGGGGSFMCTPD